MSDLFGGGVWGGVGGWEGGWCIGIRIRNARACYVGRCRREGVGGGGRGAEDMNKEYKDVLCRSL